MGPQIWIRVGLYEGILNCLKALLTLGMGFGVAFKYGGIRGLQD